MRFTHLGEKEKIRKKGNKGKNWKIRDEEKEKIILRKRKQGGNLEKTKERKYFLLERREEVKLDRHLEKRKGRKETD